MSESRGRSEGLAGIRAGDEVEIVRFGLSDPFTAQRFAPGRRWRCRYAGNTIMLLSSQTGQTISVSLDTARFVEVRRIDSR